jgi:hypothetical protein
MGRLSGRFVKSNVLFAIVNLAHRADCSQSTIAGKRLSDP